MSSQDLIIKWVWCKPLYKYRIAKSKAVPPISVWCSVQHLFQDFTLYCALITEDNKTPSYFAIDNGQESTICYYFRTTFICIISKSTSWPVILLYTIGQVRINVIFWCKITHKLGSWQIALKNARNHSWSFSQWKQYVHIRCCCSPEVKIWGNS